MEIIYAVDTPLIMASWNPNKDALDRRRHGQASSPLDHDGQFYRTPANLGMGGMEVNPRSEILTSVPRPVETRLHSHPEYVDPVETDDMSIIFMREEANSLPFTSRVRNNSDSSGSHSPVEESNPMSDQVLEECVANTPLNPSAARFRERESVVNMNNALAELVLDESDPNTTLDHSGASDHEGLDLDTYEGRLSTYSTWQHECIAKEVLAEAGFYFTGTEDLVICAGCGNALQDWESGDDPRATHRSWFGEPCF